MRFSFPEKVRREMLFFPYRKPTQVGWSSRLRRAREGGLRNSANNLDVSYARCPARCYIGPQQKIAKGLFN